MVDVFASAGFGHAIEGSIIAGRGQSREKSLGVGRPDALLTSALGLHVDLRPAGEDGGGEATARSEFAADDAPFGANSGEGAATEN